MFSCKLQVKYSIRKIIFYFYFSPFPAKQGTKSTKKRGTERGGGARARSLTSSYTLHLHSYFPLPIQSFLFSTISNLPCLFPGVENTQDIQEEVEDVKVEIDGAENILVRAKLSHNKLRINDKECAKESGAHDGDCKLHLAAKRHEQLERRRRERKRKREKKKERERKK